MLVLLPDAPNPDCLSDRHSTYKPHPRRCSQNDIGGVRESERTTYCNNVATAGHRPVHGSSSRSDETEINAPGYLDHDASVRSVAYHAVEVFKCRRHRSCAALPLASDDQLCQLFPCDCFFLSASGEHHEALAFMRLLRGLRTLSTRFSRVSFVHSFVA